MDEILYIARIDGRPWAGHGAVTKSIVPFVLFFGSLETTRYLLNERVQIPEFEKYFVTALAALMLIFLHDLGIARWRTAYTTKFIQDLFFIALISTAAFNASRSVWRAISCTIMIFSAIVCIAATALPTASPLAPASVADLRAICSV